MDAVKRVQAAAGNALEDHWQYTFAGPAPKHLVGRFVKAAGEWVERGRRPELIVLAGLLLAPVSREYRRACAEAFGSPATDSSVETAMLEASDLLAQGFEWTDVIGAVAEAARRGDTFIDRSFNALRRERVTRDRVLDLLAAAPLGRMPLPDAVARAVGGLSLGSSPESGVSGRVLIGA